MLRPKIDGTLTLERVTHGRDLDFQVFFSSTTALLGAAGLAHYAAANMFLDATRRHCEQDGPSRSLCELGHVGSDAPGLGREVSAAYREGGLQPMRASAALDALGVALLGGTEAQVVIAEHRLGGAQAVARSTARAAVSVTARRDRSQHVPPRGDDIRRRSSSA